MKEKKTVQFTVHITETDHELLKKLAHDMSISKGKLVRLAVRLYLELRK